MNNQSFSRPMSAKDIQRQIQEGIAELKCSFCEDCEFFNSCDVGMALYHEELESRARADFYNLGSVEESFDFVSGEKVFDVFEAFDNELFDQDICPIEMAEIEIGMLKATLMLNPDNASLDQEELDRMAAEEYRLCHED